MLEVLGCFFPMALLAGCLLFISNSKLGVLFAADLQQLVKILTGKAVAVAVAR